MSIPSQNLEVFAEMARSHTQRPGVRAQFSHTVVEQDKAPQPGSIPGTSNDSPQSSEATLDHGVASGFTALSVIKTSQWGSRWSSSSWVNSCTDNPCKKEVAASTFP